MTIINQNKPKRNIQNLDRQTAKRINRLTRSFHSAKPNQQGQMLKMLATEINQTQNGAVKNWLVRFELTLRAKMEVVK